jgi:hypothetical protein
MSVPVPYTGFGSCSGANMCLKAASIWKWSVCHHVATCPDYSGPHVVLLYDRDICSIACGILACGLEHENECPQERIIVDQQSKPPSVVRLCWSPMPS